MKPIQHNCEEGTEERNVKGTEVGLAWYIKTCKMAFEGTCASHFLNLSPLGSLFAIQHLVRLCTPWCLFCCCLIES